MSQNTETNIKLSVIVPIYKVENYVRECVESIVSSSYNNIEIILVDDGSPDKCGEICDEFASQDNRIKVIHKKNGGLVSARKAGARIATGEYLTFVDGDDWIAPDWYEQVIHDVEKSNADIHVSGYYEYSNGEIQVGVNELATGLYAKNKKDADLFLTVLCDERMKTKCIPAVWVKTFRTELFQQNMDSIDDAVQCGEDTLFSIACMKNANSIQINNECIGYFYRIIAQSMSHAYLESYWRQVEAYNENLDRILACYYGEKTRKRIILSRVYMITRYIDRELFYGNGRNVFSRIRHFRNVISKSIKLQEALREQKNYDLQVPLKVRIKIILLKYKLIGLLYLIESLFRLMRCMIRGIKRTQKCWGM